MNILRFFKPMVISSKYGNNIQKDVDNAAILYKELQSAKYSTYPCETKELGEDMAIVNEVIDGYWKPRFLIDNTAKTAVEFMNNMQMLVTVTTEDIDWDSLKHLNEDVLARAQRLDFGFPSFIHEFEHGVAEVSWQLNPDGMYYMDEDGYGMTNDREITIYGFIDRQGNVLVKFHAINKYKELDADRKKAERIVREKGQQTKT